MKKTGAVFVSRPKKNKDAYRERKKAIKTKTTNPNETYGDEKEKFLEKTQFSPGKPHAIMKQGIRKCKEKSPRRAQKKRKAGKLRACKSYCVKFSCLRQSKKGKGGTPRDHGKGKSQGAKQRRAMRAKVEELESKLAAAGEGSAADDALQMHLAKPPSGRQRPRPFSI